MAETVKFKPVFVQTKNVRSFDTLMQGLMIGKGGAGEGDERLGCIWGRAGRGKTRTVQTWAARNGCVYIETVSIWSELDFLQKLCREFGIRQIPSRRGRCFDAIIEAMTTNNQPVFIDEIERFGQKFLEIIRDLVKITGGIVVLIGEEELPHLMKQNRRVWSRTYRAMEFEPVSPSDVVMYVSQCTGLQLSTPAAEIMHRAAGGDLRIVRRDTINLAHAATSLRRTGEVDAELAAIACKCGLQG
ncbi:bacteriophage DNA transposition B protein [Desulfobulbus propionicus DSM 2032]|uniref:Bacteriophage DNA transposition B protein n=1 Tax=Desulfobulbus propionicus (strain ATCC 33891 / DSM 2032 / VKM B-1956 / 1pr3) TaxID=577650 RepID=A0A7U3YNF4_DESPD|nr:AAA family ATPase [Desulfobulbus propionicus]ADW18600.1 bacteriophage DNA transposition B protein [Desulfobulbus propionicus DSM 2032]